CSLCASLPFAFLFPCAPLRSLRLCCLFLSSSVLSVSSGLNPLPPKRQPAEAFASAGTFTHSTSFKPPYLHWPPVALSGLVQFQIRPDPLPATSGSHPRRSRRSERTHRARLL